jgi:hypothetical protein
MTMYRKILVTATLATTFTGVWVYAYRREIGGVLLVVGVLSVLTYDQYMYGLGGERYPGCQKSPE